MTNTTNLPPCPTEDSDNCYWDAHTMGNGEGTSFITVQGVTTYEPQVDYIDPAIGWPIAAFLWGYLIIRAVIHLRRNR